MQQVELDKKWEVDRSNTEELIPGKAIYVRHLLSAQECQRFRELIESNPALVEQLGTSTESYQFRNRLVCHQGLAMGQLWTRVEEVVDTKSLFFYLCYFAIFLAPQVLW